MPPKFCTEALPNREPFELRAKTQHFKSPPSFDLSVFQNLPYPRHTVQVMNFLSLEVMGKIPWFKFLCWFICRFVHKFVPERQAKL